MGWLIIHGDCFICGRMFHYNPERVPSWRDHTGERQPICENCIHVVNIARLRKGLDPFPIHPDAYEPQEVD